MEGAWYKNGRELVYFNQALEWIRKIKKQFSVQVEYEGYPMLPDCWLEIMNIYGACPNDDEKNMIMHAISMEFIESLRHWKVDRDDLYGRGRWKVFRCT